MKIIDASALYDTDRHVECPKGGFRSIRLLLESDNMGFSVTQTTIPAGEWQRWHYKNHLEACYCIAGMAKLKNEVTDEEYLIQPGIMYALDKNDPHLFKAMVKTRLICIFNPPLKGREIHNEDGSYDI